MDPTVKLNLEDARTILDASTSGVLVPLDVTGRLSDAIADAVDRTCIICGSSHGSDDDDNPAAMRLLDAALDTLDNHDASSPCTHGCDNDSADASCPVHGIASYLRDLKCSGGFW
jgi:hypothetical protein